jgi:phage terminase large subunit
MDFKHPDYLPIFAQRTERLRRLRTDPAALAAMRLHYKAHPIEFINDWGITVDPRVITRGRSPIMPFILFPRQREWLEFTLQNWHDGKAGLTEKSRDMGVSWLAMSLSCTLCLFYDNMRIGFGSAKEDKVDRIGDPDCLFYKGRTFLQHLPQELRGGFDPQRHAPHMRIIIPATGAVITGEAGDNIGRGGRNAIYFIDEAAHLERPQLAEASLLSNAECRQDMSSVNGMATPFSKKRFSGSIRVFTFHWRSDPRKSEEWYRQQCAELDPVIVAQEIDINHSASAEGVLIPSAWVQAAIGTDRKLGIRPTGSKFAGLDVGDEGRDKNAMAGRHGFLLNYLKSWSGSGSDIFRTVVKAFAICDEMGYETFDYDGDGLGAGVRGDADQINEQRQRAGRPVIRDAPFRGSGAVSDPEGEMVAKRKNKDFFANAKAQSWWALRIRFQNTYRAVVERMPYQPDDLIAIDENLAELSALQMELSQPTYSVNTVGKIVIDKTPAGTRSPNLADSVMIAYQPGRRALDIWARCAG